MIKFIGEEAKSGHTDRDLAKTDPEISGNNSKDIIKNIYDLEGNYFEWTAESYDTDKRVLRGGRYSVASEDKFYSASSRDNNYPTDAGSDYSSRIALYVNI